MTESETLDLNVVDQWLRKDPIRWKAGILGGIFAASMAMLAAMLITVLK